MILEKLKLQQEVCWHNPNQKPFAHAMGKAKLERCPYVTVGADGSMDASQWNAVLEKIVRQIDARSENLWFENLLKFLNRITKP